MARNPANIATVSRLLPALALAFALAVTVALVTAFATWPLAQSDLRRQQREHVLQEISGLLADNAKLVDELRQVEGAVAEGAILSTYLDLIRKDGVPRHSATKRSIDRLVDNNTVIVALTRHYLEQDASATFRAAASQYIDYAAALRDRSQAVFEIFMAGGNLPAANGERPAIFEQELKAERSGNRAAANGP